MASAHKVIEGKHCVSQVLAAACIDRTVRQFQSLGFAPFLSDGTRKWYEVKALVRYVEERANAEAAAPSSDDPKGQLTALKVQELELDLQERLGALLQRDSIVSAAESISLEAGAIISGVPHSVAYELVGKTDPLEIAAIIERALAGARAKISELGVVVPPIRSDRNGHRALNGH